jgi:4'-phosphopantetheinyl transferase
LCKQPELKPAEVHLWLLDPADYLETAALDSFAGSLDEQEQERFERFVFDNVRQRFLVSHGLLRAILSLYMHLDPGELRFQRQQYGKPELCPAQNPRGIRFNLSHTGNAVALAVSMAGELGVDVEQCREGRRFTSIATRYFSPREIADLQSCDVSHRAERFYQLWTLKEAYIKARGLGLAIPLESFSYRFHGETGLSMGQAGYPQSPWNIWLLNSGKDYAAALALLQSGGRQASLTGWRYLPDGSARPEPLTIARSFADTA